MTATETLRSSPKLLDSLHKFLTEDEAGLLFNRAITEFVLGRIPATHDQSNHGTIFRAGHSSGLVSVRTFIDEFNPETVAESARKKAADDKIRTPHQLPSQIEAMKTRLAK